MKHSCKNECSAALIVLFQILNVPFFFVCFSVVYALSSLTEHTYTYTYIYLYIFKQQQIFFLNEKIIKQNTYNLYIIETFFFFFVPMSSVFLTFNKCLLRKAKIYNKSECGWLVRKKNVYFI